MDRGSWGGKEGEKSDSLLILCTILWFGSSRSFLILCTNNDVVWIHMQYRHFCQADNLCVSKEEAIIIIIRSVLYPPIFCVLLVCEIKNTQNVQKEEIVTLFIAHLIFPGIEGFE